MRAPNKQKRRGQEVGKSNIKCMRQGTGRKEEQCTRTKSRQEREKKIERVCPPQNIATCARDTRSLSACFSKATTKGEKGSRGREDRGRRGRGKGGESKAERGERGRGNDDGRAKKKKKTPRTQTPKSARRE